jgi:3-hydroxymyristoyl/3-hydroxydecanoyl-(acyl carrier protein) dehydratase
MEVETALAIADDHPSYAGHFPGRPILPGVVLLAEAIAAIEAATGRPVTAWRLDNAKFLGVVTPGTRLALVHEMLDSGAVRFEVRASREVVASGTLSPNDR